MLVAAGSLSECGFSLSCLFLSRREILFGLGCLFRERLDLVLALANVVDEKLLPLRKLAPSSNDSNVPLDSFRLLLELDDRAGWYDAERGAKATLAERAIWIQRLQH